MKLNDIELIELNEAFASQSIAVIRELGLNEEICNGNGGAIIGSPVGCTGTKSRYNYLMKCAEEK